MGLNHHLKRAAKGALIAGSIAGLLYAGDEIDFKHRFVLRYAYAVAGVRPSQTTSKDYLLMKPVVVREHDIARLYLLNRRTGERRPVLRDGSAVDGQMCWEYLKTRPAWLWERKRELAIDTYEAVRDKKHELIEGDRE